MNLVFYLLFNSVFIEGHELCDLWSYFVYIAWWLHVVMYGCPVLTQRFFFKTSSGISESKQAFRTGKANRKAPSTARPRLHTTQQHKEKQKPFSSSFFFSKVYATKSEVKVRETWNMQNGKADPTRRPVFIVRRIVYGIFTYFCLGIFHLIRCIGMRSIESVWKFKSEIARGDNFLS